jgi:CubicO group peptidase (beta-lactamase class C family)
VARSCTRTRATGRASATSNLRDGVWDGRRLLPEGWVDHARSASTAPNNGSYGAHFWIKRPPAEGQWLLLPGAPESTFAAEGAYFQTVAIPPTLDLVAVRLGDTQGAEFGELKASFGRMLGAFPEAAAP